MSSVILTVLLNLHLFLLIPGELTCEGSRVPRSHLTPAEMGFL